MPLAPITLGVMWRQEPQVTLVLFSGLAIRFSPHYLAAPVRHHPACGNLDQIHVRRIPPRTCIFMQQDKAAEP